MKRVRWAPAAADDLESIYSYLRQHLPTRADSTMRKLYQAALSLRNFPHRGRLGEAEGTRELMALPLPYIIVYGVDSEFVHIFRIIHGAGERSDLLQ